MRTSLAPRAPRPPMASLTCHICNVSLLLGPSGVGFGGVIAALRRRTLAPVLKTAHREEGAGLLVTATEENAMTLLPRRGVKASLISLAIVATAYSCGGGPSAAPQAGCNAGTTPVLFSTSHTPPDTDRKKHMVHAFNKQSTPSRVRTDA